MPTQVDIRLLTAKEAAAYLSIGRTKIWALLYGGELGCVRIGRSVRLEKSELDRFISSRRVGGADAGTDSADSD